MAADAREESTTVVNKSTSAEGDDLDPTDTDHATGAQQAADNAATESPS